MSSGMQPLGSKCAAIIGDVIASRGYGDQTRLLEGVADVLAQVNAVTTSFQPLQMTIGDEFQGAYHDLGTALDACLQTRLRLVGQCDVRFGIGWGEIVASDPQRAPMAQSGSAWWAARAALEHASDATSRKEWPRGIRTWFQGGGHDTDRIVNAFLLCRDELVTKMDESEARATLGLYLGKRQSDLARELGIKQPSVSSKQHGSGAVAVVRAHEILKGLVP